MKSFIHRLEVKFVLLATIVIILGATIINFIIYTWERDQHYKMAKSRAELLTSFASNVIVSQLNGSINLSDRKVQASISGLLEQMSNTQANGIRCLTILDSKFEPALIYGDSTFCKTISFEHVQTAFERDTLMILEAFHQNENAIETYKPINSNLKTVGVLFLIMSSEKEQAGIRELTKNLIMITVTVSIISIFMAIIVARMLAKPIKILAREMELVESPYYKTSLKKNRKDELGTLQERFLVMLARLRKSEQEKEKAGSALIQAEKMASIGTLASGIAHEINNPLAGLKQSVQRIMVNPHNIKQTKKYISMIHDSLLHIEKVVKGLLDFSRKRKLKLKSININEVLEDSLRMLQYEIKTNKIKCTKSLDNKLKNVFGDIYYLQQVFINLLLNAIDAMPEGGELTVRSFKNVTHAMVEIEDSGHGIEESQLDKVFDPFYTTKEEGKGTGLGLAICYSIVTEHGGDITIESKVGIGTKVAISLPYA